MLNPEKPEVPGPTVPGPTQPPPPIEPFIPKGKTKTFVPFKYKLYTVLVVVIGLYLLIGLTAHR